MATQTKVTVSTKSICGFCMSGNHEGCSVGVKYQGQVKHAKYPEGIVWACKCECAEGKRKCAICNNRNTPEVDPDTWECFDRESCLGRVEAKRADDPFLAQLREVQERAKMAKIEENQAKAEKAEKAKEPTFCLVTGEPTKGGLFKPGMDARYVSERVIECENANFTKAAREKALAKMKKDGVSEKLVAKFEKSVGLAQEKVEKREAAKKAKAEAKEAEKAEKAAANA